MILLLFVTIGISYFHTATPLAISHENAWEVLYKTTALGYQTLDLLAMLFVYSLMFTLLKSQSFEEVDCNSRALPKIALRAGFIALLFLTIVYVGLLHLGSTYSPLTSVSHGKLFEALSFQLFGPYGTLITGFTIILTCFSTAMALATLVASWLHHSVFNNAIGYKGSLLIVLALSIPSSMGILESTLKLSSGPLIIIGYPVIITITVCNILYKTIGFKPIKTPTAIAFIVATAAYIFMH